MSKKYELYGRGKFREITDQTIQDHNMIQCWFCNTESGFLIFSTAAQAEAYAVGIGGTKIYTAWVRPNETVI